MALTPEEKTKLIEEFRAKEGDTGGTAVQIAILSQDVRRLTEHLTKHKKDFHTRRGLMKKVGRRNRLLRYLKRKDAKSYGELIKRLELRG
ncbi:MAG: 30S ribosomal protein S15 [Planctomycetes bacterium]|jgi:small subunit ribosomal protein S15|nr:30S ribosomal protein S15 [Planctomycetota bacterium]MDP6424885.1 30S ribosomal protein S15 [Planctomycetota bacterium]